MMLVVMIELKATEMQWMAATDERTDQCAHGRVSFIVNGTVFVRPEEAILTISSTALFLLRTIESDHSIDQSVAENNQLFSCCGSAVWPDEGGRYGVVVIGCAAGIDLEIHHEEGQVRISEAGGRSETVTSMEWSRAVAPGSTPPTMILTREGGPCSGPSGRLAEVVSWRPRDLPLPLGPGQRLGGGAGYPFGVLDKEGSGRKRRGSHRHRLCPLAKTPPVH
jgi:hypothetical protein